MFFPEKILSIKKTDRVLEIGPGSMPFPRADFFLEKKFDSDEVRLQQSGNAIPASLKKPVYFYDGGSFPFDDKEFDYVICSHVIEHVEDVEHFGSELFRIANKGYLEYPTIYYEYLYNFKVHLNFLKKNNNNLFYLKKNNLDFDKYYAVQKFFYESLTKGYTNIVDDLKIYMFEGFEWIEPFRIIEAKNLDQLIFENYHINKKNLGIKSFPRKFFNYINTLTGNL